MSGFTGRLAVSQTHRRFIFPSPQDPAREMESETGVSPLTLAGSRCRLTANADFVRVIHIFSSLNCHLKRMSRVERVNATSF